ncbi:claudin-15-like [Myxocyprinus asiaticus]|uniref:claudin-15-like n=1 Tax=Myxocyprinus asiaticus TaxID=70543 RepID=UPI002222A630|nr:claudin-15-like [Myxocyprinus asiaticus]
MSIAVELVGFLMCVGGWLLTGVALANDYWRVSSFSGSVITSVWYYQNLWQACAEQSSGISNCREFESLLALPVHIQTCRALMIIALILGLLSVILSILGLKCTKMGSMTEQTKGKMALMAGVLFILSGLCVLIAVSWYATQVIQEFNNPLNGGIRYELGTGLYLGWSAGGLVLLGGVFLCTSFKTSQSPAQSRGYNYSTTQPQKIYRTDAPSENISSKAYI